MTTWQPDADETLLARCGVGFATGVATPVSGMRWFRDTERRDIQDELPGWPAGQRFAPRTKTERRLRDGRKFGARFLLVATLGVLESLAGSGSTGNVARLGQPEEPENEVEDFPVMWAASGTLARTLPWQLDPGRRPDIERTHMVVTDRRVLVLGLLDDKDEPNDEVLWETPRSNVAAAQRMQFSQYEVDFKLVFVDGSWCRLAGWNTNCRDDVTRFLATPPELVAREALTAGQRQTIAKFLKRQGQDRIGDLLITRRPSGHFRAEYLRTDLIDPDYGISSDVCLMGANGETVNYEQGDL
ncbi:hypothetical protein [Streptomyces sp. VMFN-G11Ma]|jgi:hypothetical protein|uniref:hypothetical protein n=1 Tax=Streptomyces sp. VMFN-G11Ma TaxID=2135609 RepID=UPI000D3BFE80|nr:hypothetical protein [Streptomyces sp. VMFN-G11Ma]PTM91200.1 hypothetical protein C7821_111175 [Streptomyces sp. VMFN-G11Ma]